MDSYSSRAYVTACLKQPTRIQRGPRQRIPIWSCSERGLPSPQTVTSCAVRSYRTLSPLPYASKIVGRYTLCCTFRRLAPPRGYLAFCPMEPGLSSVTEVKAAVWPTPAATLQNCPTLCKKKSALNSIKTPNEALKVMLNNSGKLHLSGRVAGAFSIDLEGHANSCSLAKVRRGSYFRLMLMDAIPDDRQAPTRVLPWRR